MTNKQFKNNEERFAQLEYCGYETTDHNHRLCDNIAYQELKESVAVMEAFVTDNTVIKAVVYMAKEDFAALNSGVQVSVSLNRYNMYELVQVVVPQQWLLFKGKQSYVQKQEVII